MKTSLCPYKCLASYWNTSLQKWLKVSYYRSGLVYTFRYSSLVVAQVYELLSCSQQQVKRAGNKRQGCGGEEKKPLTCNFVTVDYPLRKLSSCNLLV